MDVEEDLEEPHPHSPQKTNILHAHRLDHNPSKLPAFRFVDLNRIPLAVSTLLSPNSERASALLATKQGITSSVGDEVLLLNTTASTPVSPYSPNRRPSTSPGASVGGHYFPITVSPSQTEQSIAPRLQDRRLRRAPASHSSNGIETATGPPPALSTQRSSTGESPRVANTSTSEWALAQQQLTFQTLNSSTVAIKDTKTDDNTRDLRGASKSLDDSTSNKALIPPIRSFRSSATRASLEMNGRSFHRFEAQADNDDEFDRDHTLRALEGYSYNTRNTQNSHPADQNEQRQPDMVAEDLFLNLARDDLDNQEDSANRDSFNQSERRRSRIALASNRQSLPLSTSSYKQSPIQSMPRRRSDVRDPPTTASREDNIETLELDRISYQPSVRNRVLPSSIQPASESHRKGYATAIRSFPSTPRTESQLSSGRRRSSIPDSTGSTVSRSNSYRPSNLNFSTSRVYNSSPLVSRNREAEDGLEVARLAEGTESTTSTTAPSTVWDELDDLKSRIRKLELTGKLPATSGAAVSRASGERPPTATTTITSMSTSPKRGRNLSTSPIESNVTGLPTGDTHPLLHSALAKSKPLLHPEIYRALESTASDALTLATITGSVGQPGTTSSTQSVIGIGTSTMSDRQLRRKADSLCRGLTELCLALSEVRPEQVQQPNNQALIRPVSRDKDFQSGAAELPLQQSGDALATIKAGPRALSRLEARRSSLLATSSLPSPRYPPSDASTPTQSTVTSRRTSVILRNRRAGTEEADDDDQTRFRAPSRAATEITRTRNSPREYTSQQPLPELRAPSVQSSLPLRRQYVSSALNSNVPHPPPPVSNPLANGRRFLDRSTPERDMTNSSLIGKLAEERGQRGPTTAVGFSFEGRGLGRSGSLGKERRLRPQTRERMERTDSDTSTQVQMGAYQ